MMLQRIFKLYENISKLASSIFAGISCFVRVASVVRQRREGVGSAPLIISSTLLLSV